MTKKDYELIALSVWRAGYFTDKNKVREKGRRAMQRSIAIDLASSLGNENPRFHRVRFIKACGVSEN